MDLAVQPEDVFTPAAPVQEDMFASRRHEHLEERVEGALAQRGRQVMVHGDTGVGKTSLVYHLCRVRKIPMVRVECGPPFDDLLRHALSEVADEQIEERTTRSTREVETGVNVLNVVRAGGTLGGEESTLSVPVARSLAVVVTQALEEAGVRVLFLDNFENLDGEPHAGPTKRAIVQLLKSLADRAEDGEPHLKAVVAGIPSASRGLVTLDAATARRTAQIEVPRMPDDELDQILSRGEAKLGITFGGFARYRIVRYSDGFPYYTHLLALHTSKRAMRDGRTEVDLDDFDAALGEILADVDLALRTQYDAAIETSGEVRLRKSIMEAIASLEATEVTFKQIREAFLARHPEYGDLSRLNFLSTAIKPLKDDYQVLADRGMTKSRNNLYRFRNPLMRGYVRLRMRRDHPERPGLWDPDEGPVTTTSS